MSKSSHASPVQLFPFLAVLICAMGALILLLLVTTRRIRHVAVEKAIKEQQAALEVAARTPILPPSTPATDVALAHLYVPPAAIPLARPVPVVDEAAAVRLRAEWASIVQELARDYSAEVKQLAAIRAEALARDEERKTAEAAITEQIKRIDAQKLRAQRLREETAADVARLDEERSKIDGTIRGVRKATQVKAEDLANQPVPYTLLPYDGALGTTRRPIIIECDERSIIFRCEGIELTSVQLSGFPSDYNPLLAGVRALHEYWVVRDRETATVRTPPPPYVLLVVRPKGTVAFYVARKLLEKFEHPFGYELVEEGRELTWPASDEQATRVCRESIERVLAERERLMTRVPGGRPTLPGELRYDGQEGEFATEEVERLRNLDASVVVGGQRWRRDPKNIASGDPTPFQSAARGPGAGLAPGQGSASGPAGSDEPGTEFGRGAPRGARGTGAGSGEFPDSVSPGQYKPGGLPSGMPSEEELASTDPRGTGNGPGGPDDASPPLGRRPSPNDHRILPGTRTFQGSSGPRLGSTSGGGRPPASGSHGDLHPWHDNEKPSDETVLPQGTGPINSRSLASGGSGRPGSKVSGGPGQTSQPAGSPSGGSAGPQTGGTSAGGVGAPRTRLPDGSGGPASAPDSPGGLDPFAESATQGNPFGRLTQAPSGPEDSEDSSAGSPGPSDGARPGTGRRFTGTGAGAGGGAATGAATGPGATSGSGTPYGPGPSGSSGGATSPFGGNAHSPFGGGPAGSPSEAAPPEGMPVPRNLRAIGQGDPNARGKPADRRWGTPDHDGSIALERSVTIEVKEQGVFLEDEPEISLREGTAYRELKDRLAYTLDGHVGKWGRPPASFYWLPTVTFRIHPGGNQYYQALKALTDDWGLRSKVEHVLE